MSYPVTSMVMPSDLKGAANGKLASGLMSVMAYPNTSKAQLHKSCGSRAFDALDGTVQDLYGETLTTTSTPDCYRTFDQQYNTFHKRYTTDPISGAPTKQCEGKTWYLQPGYAGAACPGNSNHGWALARDTGLYKSGGVQSITTAKCWKWLLEHADEFGICWESQSEPWHLRYFKGDKIPDAVLAWEGGSGGSTPPTGGSYVVDAVRSDVKKGSTGDMAKRCQFALNLSGASPQLVVDGQFGSKSEAALKQFQAANGLSADGQCGPKTWTRLED